MRDNVRSQSSEGEYTLSKKKWKYWHIAISWISGIVAPASLAFAYWGFADKFAKDSPVKVAQAIILVIWIVVPPVWFWFEFFFLYLPLTRDPDRPFKMSWDEYKFAVDVSAKIWLALVTALLGLYFGKDFTKG
jgi:hypothetical protein